MNEFFQTQASQNTYENLAKAEVIYRLQKSLLSEKSLVDDNKKLKSRLSKLEAMIAEMKQGNLEIRLADVIDTHNRFAKSSERSTKEEIAAANNSDALKIPGADDSSKKDPKKRVLKPSVRYPNAEVKEIHLIPAVTQCPCCSETMVDSDMTEESEKLSVIPKKFIIEKTIKHKFRCDHCQGAIITPASLPSIIPGGAYADALILDVAVAKYLDLMPISRYAKSAERLGIKDLPAQSLIDGTHALANCIRGVYRLLKQEILSSRVLFADETPHKMLEGSDKERWYLWGFTCKTAAFFSIKDTRSGDVASRLLKDSKCEFLSSDVYSGYGKAVRETNEYRKTQNLPTILNVYCNAHARRNFKKAEGAFKLEASFFIDRYRSIYYLESQLTSLREKDPDLPHDKILEIRKKMRIFYEEMKSRATHDECQYPSDSSIAKAMRYLVNHFDQLTLFMGNAELPIDNNQAERILRNPVIGRKTWYGTHSIDGSETAAILFSVIESCKLNKVNPLKYLTQLVATLHKNEPAFTPSVFAKTQD